MIKGFVLYGIFLFIHMRPSVIEFEEKIFTLMENTIFLKYLTIFFCLAYFIITIIGISYLAAEIDAFLWR